MIFEGKHRNYKRCAEKTLLSALVGRKALAEKVVGRRADPLAVLQSHLGAHPMMSPASSARIPAEFGKLYEFLKRTQRVFEMSPKYASIRQLSGIFSPNNDDPARAAARKQI